MKALAAALILALVAAPGLAQTKKNSFSDADLKPYQYLQGLQPVG